MNEEECEAKIWEGHLQLWWCGKDGTNQRHVLGKPFFKIADLDEAVEDEQLTEQEALALLQKIADCLNNAD